MKNKTDFQLGRIKGEMGYHEDGRWEINLRIKRPGVPIENTIRIPFLSFTQLNLFILMLNEAKNILYQKKEEEDLKFEDEGGKNEEI